MPEVQRWKSCGTVAESIVKIDGVEMNHLMRVAAIIVLLVAVTAPGYARQSQSTEASSEVQQLKSLVQDDTRVIEAIVLYPEAERVAIMKASSYPEALVQLNRIRSHAVASFQTAAESLTVEEQNVLRFAVRHPEAFKQLSSKPSREQLAASFGDAPEGMIDTAMKLTAKDEGRKVIDSVGRLYASAIESADRVIAAYPADAKDAFRQLIKTPEILAVLVDHLDQTVLLGAIYKKDPAFALKRSAELNTEVKERNQRNLKDWHAAFQNNPALWSEMKVAATAYAGEKSGTMKAGKGADSFWLLSPGEDQKSMVGSYDWGFSKDASDKITIYGLPSGAFTSWIISQNNHPLLKSFFVQFFQSHADGATGFHAAMRTAMLEEKQSKSLLAQASRMNLNPTINPPDAPSADQLPPGLHLGPAEKEEIDYQALDYFRYSTMLKVRENIYGVKY